MQGKSRPRSTGGLEPDSGIKAPPLRLRRHFVGENRAPHHEPTNPPRRVSPGVGLV